MNCSVWQLESQVSVGNDPYVCFASVMQYISDRMVQFEQCGLIAAQKINNCVQGTSSPA